MFDKELFKRVLIKPAEQGADELEIISGYAAASMAKRHLQELQSKELNPHIRLTVGMAGQGINLPQHKGFKLIHKPPSFSCNYWGKSPLVHAKVYAWLRNGKPFAAFTGSANYTHNGFGKGQKEILTEVDAKTAVDWCKIISNDAYFCDDVEIENVIPFKTDEHTDRIITLERHSLPLHEKGEKKVHNRAGLNWGQRENREPNQAYIPIPSELQYRNSDFFPPIKHPFTVLTDDGFSMILVAAQQNGKALHSTENNSELGLYFRKRLGLQSGEYVTYNHLEKYGRLEVEFRKIDEETFFMDFSPK